MTLLVSQNQLGVLAFDGRELRDIWRLPGVANGVCTSPGRVYLANKEEILELDTRGKLLNTLTPKTPGAWVDLHTIRWFKGRLLLAVTGKSEVHWGDEVVFAEKQRGSHGINCAIPWRDDTIIIGYRNIGMMVAFDIVKRKEEFRVKVPDLLNSHNFTPYVDETFLVSGPASCILFNRAGEVLLQSPPTYWPRGVLVRSKTEVWLAGAVSLKRWDPDTNTCGPPLKSVIAPRGIHAGPALNREPPLQKKTPFTGRRIHGGAMFDIAWQDDEVPLHPLEEQPWYSDLLKDWEMESAVPDLATRIATHAVTLAAPGRATYLEGVVAMHPELTLELLNERVREMLTAWKEA